MVVALVRFVGKTDVIARYQLQNFQLRPFRGIDLGSSQLLRISILVENERRESYVVVG